MRQVPNDAGGLRHPLLHHRCGFRLFMRMPFRGNLIMGPPNPGGCEHRRAIPFSPALEVINAKRLPTELLVLPSLQPVGSAIEPVTHPALLLSARLPFAGISYLTIMIVPGLVRGSTVPWGQREEARSGSLCGLVRILGLDDARVALSWLLKTLGHPVNWFTVIS